MPEENPKQRGPAVRDPGDEHAPSALDAVLARAGEAIRAPHLSPRTEDAYVRWVRRFVRYFDGRDPASMGCAEIRTFLSSLATERSASTQNQAFSALLFLYRDVLGRELTDLPPEVAHRNPTGARDWGWQRARGVAFRHLRAHGSPLLEPGRGE